MLRNELTLPRFFSNGMVLQRNQSIRIWGFAAPNQPVEITFLGKTQNTAADSQGNWSLTLPPHPHGGPYRMEVTAEKTILIQDVWIGEVWVFSGQSNMGVPMFRVGELYEQDVDYAYNPQIRIFTAPCRYIYNAPKDDLEAGQWEFATSETVLHMSAVSYYFARSIFERYHVPVGILNVSVGGSHAESWMSEEALQSYPDMLAKIEALRDNADRDRLLAQSDKAALRWQVELDGADLGLLANKRWSEEQCDDSGWNTMVLPGYWKDTALDDLHGAVWFRREFYIPDEYAGAAAKLTMGRIVDNDAVYVNGILVGSTEYQYPPRRYAIPASILKAGKNTIAVRVVNFEGNGGFATGKSYEISFQNKYTVPLAGEWKYRVGATSQPMPERLQLFHYPLGLYNGMLAPIIGYTIKGFSWYQGESNTHTPHNYQELMCRLITEWRQRWGLGELPFLIVQLPNFLEPDSAVKEGWCQLREQQRKALALPNTAMAVTIDVGEWHDLHPLNKKAVGARLALLARRYAYGEELICSGPLPRAVARKGSALIIAFDEECGGLATSDGAPPRMFELAGADGHFTPAVAQVLDSLHVRVVSEGVPEPAAVRYAWRDAPEEANLCGIGGLPASPFCEGV